MSRAVVGRPRTTPGIGPRDRRPTAATVTCSASGTTGPGRRAVRRGRAGPARARRRADRGAGRRRPAAVRLAAATAWCRRWRCWPTRRTRPRRRGRSGRSRCSPRSGRRCAGPVDHGVAGSATCLVGLRRPVAAALARRGPGGRLPATTASSGAAARRPAPGRHRRTPEPDAGVRCDPIAVLAAAAGLRRPGALVGRRRRVAIGRAAPFAALTEAMAELRARSRDSPAHAPGRRCDEQRREAHMRQVLRDRAEGRAPARSRSSAAPGTRPRWPGRCRRRRRTRRCCAGCRRRKVALTWVPWTHSRLAAASGYGAGITSPGWYHHLFTAPDQTSSRWLTRVAGVLREHDLPVSSAHVIEAVRLAEALADPAGPAAGRARRGDRGDAGRAVRRRRRRGCASSPGTLVVGERLGSVPDEAPPVPLDADLRAPRAAAEAADRARWTRRSTLDLRTDLRPRRGPAAAPADRAGHRLGHRHRGPGQGRPGRSSETWSLRWRPELAVDIVEAARLGHHGRRTPRPLPIIDTAANAGRPGGRDRRGGACAAGRPARRARPGAARAATPGRRSTPTSRT